MMFRKIAGPMKISTDDGSEQTFMLPPSGGGSMVKTLQYFVKVTSASANTQVGMNVQHGPEVGWYMTLKDDIVEYGTAEEGATLGGAVGAEASNTQVVGEVIQPVIKIKETPSATGARYAMVEIYEMRKPF